MASISKPVGKNVNSSYSDTVIVQLLLNKFIMPGYLALTPLVVDGKCGKKTIAAIRTFQASFLGWNKTDGRVDPGGTTLDRLNGPVTQPQWGDPSENTRQSVLKVLDGSQTAFVNFTIHGLGIHTFQFAQIYAHIAERDIEVLWDPAEGDGANYNVTTDRMTLGFQWADTVRRRSIVVHEAVHAILDLRATPITTVKSEAAAFVGQALYERHVTGKAFFETNFYLIPTRAVADIIATDIIAGKQAGDDQLKLLYDMIAAIPFAPYNQPYSTLMCNGIG